MHSSFLFAGILPLVAAEACSSVVAKTHLVTSVITTVEYTTLPSGPRCTLSHAIPSESPSGEAPPPAEESSTFEWVPPPRPSGTDFEWLPSLEPTSGEPILTTSLTPVKPSSPSSDNSEKPVPTSQPQASETSGNDYSSGTTDVSEPTGSSPASHSDVASSDSPVPTSASEKPSAPASESEPCTTSTASDSSPSSSVTTASEKPSAPASESEPCTTSTASDSSPSSAVTTASEKPSAPASESEPCTTSTGESSPSSAVTSASEKPSAPASESEPCTTSTGEASPSSASDKTSATASESEPCTTSASETAHSSAEESVTTTKPSSGATTTSAEESSEATTTSAEESSAASTSAEESAEINTSAKESSATSAAATSEVSSKTSEAPSTFSSVVTTSATTSKASTTSKAPASTTSKAPEETKPARAYPADIVDDLQDESMDNLKRWLSENNANGCTLEKASVRREWGDLSLEQREDYISAVLCLQSAPARYSSEIPGAKSRFDDFVVAHQAQTNYIHGTANFLTWHRYFLHEFEKALKGECGYKGAMPYWNWDRYANDPENSPLFNGDAGSLGGNSGASGCVETGPFKNYVVNIGPGPSTRHNPRCLRRSISKVAARYTKVDISYPLITQSNSVVQFQDRLQSGNNVHASGHHTVGGNPGADIYTSPGDPYFHLHHAGVDRLYFIWQLQDLNSRLSQVGGTNGQTGRSGSLTERMNLGRNAGDVELGSLLNTMGGLNGDLCYIYY